ncbi:Serine acetyltransferase [Dorea longicatena]|nr:Serine acetyltransferase [Dorea longicatena]
MEEVPPNCTVVGVPGRIVRRDDKKVPREELDQVHLPDPVLNDIRELQIANFQLHEQLLAMEERLKKCVEQNCKN